MKENEPRLRYEVRVPPNATPEEIAEFMKEFNKKWFGKKDEPTEPASKPDEASS